MRKLLIFSLTVLAIANFWLANIDAAAAQNLPPQYLASLFAFSGKPPANLGVKDGKLAPCPPSPNCVSSQTTDTGHQIAPLGYSGDSAAAMAKLKAIIASSERTKIIQADPNYLRAEFTSAIMGFVDDVEFYLDKQEPVIHVRSASRLGESDLGVNRHRIETIRRQFAAENFRASS